MPVPDKIDVRKHKSGKESARIVFRLVLNATNSRLCLQKIKNQILKMNQVFAFVI